MTQAQCRIFEQITDAVESSVPIVQTTPCIEAALVDHYDDFRRYLARRLNNASTVEDVLQNFCVRVIGSQTALRNEDAVVPWLYKVLRSVLIDHYRRVDSRRRHEAAFQQEQFVHGKQRDQITLEENDCNCIGELVPNLRTDYAQVLQRIDLSGDSRDAVAADLGISATNVRVRLHRARQKLRGAVIAFCGSCCESNPYNCTCAED